MPHRTLAATPEGTGHEARRESRRPVTLPGFAALDDGSRFEITVADLSYDGCRIETPIGLIAGTRLELSVIRLGALTSWVRWYANGQAGLCFNPVAARPKVARKYERLELTATVGLRRPGRQHYQTTIANLTPSGCRAEFVERPKEGEIIWTKLNGLEALEGRVRWVDGFKGGIEFTREIYPAVFDLLLTRLG